MTIGHLLHIVYLILQTQDNHLLQTQDNRIHIRLPLDNRLLHMQDNRLHIKHLRDSLQLIRVHTYMVQGLQYKYRVGLDYHNISRNNGEYRVKWHNYHIRQMQDNQCLFRIRSLIQRTLRTRLAIMHRIHLHILRTISLHLHICLLYTSPSPRD